MEIVKSKYVVNYVGSPVLIINAATLEEAMDKFDKMLVLDIGENGAIKSDHKLIEFYLVNEVE